MKNKILLISVALLSTMFSLPSCDQNRESNSSINNVAVVGVAVNSENDVRTVAVGSTLTLNAVVYPENANQDVTWTSSDVNVATVEKGVVTGVSVGTVNIVATSTENPSCSASFSIIVEKGAEQVVQPESITITSIDNVTTVRVGIDLQLTATVLPEGASQNVIWCMFHINKF